MRAVSSRVNRASPPDMNATKSSTIARCSSTVTFMEHGPPQRPICPGKHGRPVAIAFLYEASEHVRIGNTLIMRSIVSCTAQIFGYGPK